MNDDALYVDMESFALATTTKPFNVFHYRTPHMLEYVLEENYFSPALECLLRRGDRIEVLANTTGEYEYATLVVTGITNTSSMKRVKVALLFCNKAA